MDMFSMYLQGLGNNILLTLLSCILPVLFGVIWILISKMLVLNLIHHQNHIL